MPATDTPVETGEIFAELSSRILDKKSGEINLYTFFSGSALSEIFMALVLFVFQTENYELLATS
jgi:hypothetical protein